VGSQIDRVSPCCQCDSEGFFYSVLTVCLLRGFAPPIKDSVLGFSVV